MAASKELHLQLSRDQQRLLEEWLLEFEQNWSRTALDDWHDRVNSQPDPFPLAAVTELIKIDIEHRWQADDPVSIDWYLDRFAVLKSNSSFPLDLLEAEIEVRRQFGDAVELEQLLNRYPNRADEIRQVFDAAATQCAADTSHAPGKTPKQDRNSGPNAAEDNLQPGRTFGRYHIRQEIGAGAMGKVLLAEDTLLGRQVALKIPHFSGSHRHEILDRFQREARAAATIDHPNICPIYDVGMLDGVNFLSMAYIDGHPLSAYVSEENQLHNRAVAILVRKLALGLAAAHQKGIVHRDLKPDNIMIKGGSEPIVMDFGLAFSQETRAESRVTQEGALLGSPAYMSVEQVEGRIGDVGPRSDIYSLGVILYELLTGELPFQGNVTAVISQILSKSPQPPRERRHDVEPELESICLKMMSKLPDDRHADMKAVADDLTHYLKEASKHDSPATIGGNDHTIAPQAEQTSLNTERLENSDMPAKTAAEFDPYHKWLGIPPREQPPNHYRLLAIDLFETDLDVIDAAATKQITYVRQCATGPHAVASQQVLNDLSTAQLCLLDPQKKSAYDAKLKAELNALARAESAPPQTSASTDTVTSGQKVEQPVDSKLAQQTKKLDKQKKQIESLLKRCEFAAAVAALEKMAAVKSPKLAKYANWAKQQLPKAKRGTQDMRESSAAMYRTASDLFDRHDYEEAAEILQQIPQKFRNSEISKLLQECLDLQEEVADLQEDIDRAESLKKYEDLQPTVERLLEIKPNDRRARNLLKELKTYGKGGGMRLGGRGDGRFDAAGNTSNPLKVALLVVVPLVLFVAVGYATVVYVRSNNKTIKIEIDDPTANVIIDGEEVKITGVGDEITLKVGMHGLTVKRDDLVVQTRNFEVVKGKNPVLRITLQEEVAEVPLEPTTPESVATSTTPPTAPTGPTITGTKTFTGHTGRVNAVAVSPDGSRIASGGEGGMIRVWDTTSGEELMALKAVSRVTALAFSPDGKQIANGSADVQLWDAATGKDLGFLGGHKGTVYGVAFSSDGRQFASASINNTLKTWDAATGKELRTITEGSSTVTGYGCVAFSPDGKHLVTGANGGPEVKIWNAETGEETRTLSGHTKRIGEVCYSPNGKWIASGSYDGTIKIWDAATGQNRHTIEGHFSVMHGLAFSPDSKSIIAPGNDKTVKLWDAATGQEVQSTVAHAANYVSVAFSPDGKSFVGSAEDGTVWVWNVSTTNSSRDLASTSSPATSMGAAKIKAKTLTGHTDQVRGVAISPDGSKIVSASYDKTVKIWDADTSREIQTLSGHRSLVAAVAISPDGQRIASAGSEKTLKLWDAATHQQLRTIDTGQTLIFSLAFSPDGQRIVSSGSDKLISVWDASTGQKVATLSGHTDQVVSVMFSPDGKLICSGSHDESIKLWDASSGVEKKTLTGHGNRVLSAAFDGNGERIVSTSIDGSIKIWDVQTAKEIRTLPKLRTSAHTAVFSPDGKSIASGSHDGAVRLWDAETGKELQSLTGHTNAVYQVAFSSDGKRIVSGSSDRTVRVWDVVQSTSQSAGGADPFASLDLNQSVDPAAVMPGILVVEFPQHQSQYAVGGAYVQPAQLGDPIGETKITKTISPWSFSPQRNAVAIGYLKIDVDGKYAFDSNNFYDRNALFINGQRVCGYRDLAGKAPTIDLRAGLVPFMSIGYVYSRGNAHVKWQPPETDALVDIPLNRLFYSPSHEAKLSQSIRQAQNRFAGNALNPVSIDVSQLKPGLLVQTFPKHASQKEEGGILDPANPGSPIGEFSVVKSLDHWKYDASLNAFAFGYLKVEVPGEYAFMSSNFYDRNALYINGKLVCGYRDGEEKVGTIKLNPGLVPITSFGSIAARGSATVLWKSPIDRELVTIPPTSLYHNPANSKPGDYQAISAVSNPSTSGTNARKGRANLPPSPTSPAEIATLNRKVAEWALRRGGTVGTDMGSFKTADALPQQSFQIYDVTLSGKQVTNDDLSLLSGLVSLTHLRLDNTAIGDAGLSSLRGLTKLRVLLLSGTQISNAGLSNLQGLTNLESLYLGDTSIRGDGLVHLQGMTKLVDLRLANTNINDAALSHLQGLTSLNVLHLNSKDVTDAGMSHLKGLTNLKNLVINNTGVSDAGLANLKGMTDLEVLFLGNTPIVGDGLEHLQGMKKLAQLRIGSTQLTDENLVHLSSLTGLTDLRINNNRIGDEGLTHLNRLTKLKTLACDNTQVSDVGLDNIKKLKQLTTIYLQNTKVTANGVAALQQSLPQCDIKH